MKAQLRPMLQSRLAQADDGITELRALEESLRTALRRLDELPDRSEDCDPDCAFLTDGPTREPVSAPVPVAIACSLEGSAQGERLAQWQSVLAGAPIEHDVDGVVATLPVATAAVLAELVVAEQECCPFLRFEIEFTPMNLRLSITADEHARAFIDDLVRVDRAQRS